MKILVKQVEIQSNITKQHLSRATTSLDRHIFSQLGQEKETDLSTTSPLYSKQ